MRICLVTMLLFTIYCSFSQKSKLYTQQFTFTHENDTYMPLKKDGYYTNGVFFHWNSVLRNRTRKTIAQYELGQMMFTPESLHYYRVNGSDRPFCGYLYVKYGQNRFLTNNSMLQWDAQLGTTGSNSLGEQMMTITHNILNGIKFIGWENQIGNELSLNTHLAYTTTAWQPNKYVKVMPVAEGNLGNAFINAKLGTYVCVGLFESNQHSELLHAGIGTAASERQQPYELFAYWFPQYILQGYNATVQGGMFVKDSRAKSINPIIYQQTFGLIFAKNRCSLKLEVVYQTQECTTQILPQRYGSVCIGYKFN